MKKQFNQLLTKYQKTLSDSSSKALKLMKLEDFNSTVEEFKKIENQKKLHDFLLNPSDDSDIKLVSQVLFKVMFRDDFKQIANKIKHEDFIKYHSKYPNATPLDYFFEVANTESEIMGKTNDEI